MQIGDNARHVVEASNIGPRECLDVCLDESHVVGGGNSTLALGRSISSCAWHDRHLSRRLVKALKAYASPLVGYPTARYLHREENICTDV